MCVWGGGGEEVKMRVKKKVASFFFTLQLSVREGGISAGEGTGALTRVGLRTQPSFTEMRRAAAALAWRRPHAPPVENPKASTSSRLGSASGHPPPPPPPLLSRLLDGSLLDEGAVARLARDGWLVLDDALPLPHGPSRLAASILAARPFLSPNASIFVDPASGDRVRRLVKVGVGEAEPGVGGNAALDAACPALVAVREEAASLASLVAALAPASSPPGGALACLGGPGAVKAQIAQGRQAGEAGGALRGGFGLHADADEALDGRRLTLTLYPSALPPGTGGDLLLYPSLDPHAPPITIPPAPGRAVLFSACRLPHEVSPSVAERLCLSVWLGVRARGLPPPPPPTPVAAVLRGLVGASASVVRRTVLGEPDARRALGRLRLGAVWEASLARCHGPSPALDAALARGRGERAALARAFEAVGLEWGGVGLGEAGGDPAPVWF